MIHYNTLYQSLKKVSAEWHAGHLQRSYSWFYLKFYQDGVVIKTYLNGEDIEKINSWFNREAEGVTVGTYISEGSKITVKFERDEPVEGAIVTDSILLKGKGNWEEYILKE